MVNLKIKVGIFGIGLDTYWPQFEDLLDKLLNYKNEISKKIESFGVEVVDGGMVDNALKANETAVLFKKEDVEIIFLYVSTYALSSTVLPVIQKSKVPVIILNISPTKAIDYTAFNNLKDKGKMTGEWLAYCQACSVPEIASVFNRNNIGYNIVTGYLDDPEAWKEIEDWLDAARVAHVMKNGRVGILGHYYSGMLDVYSNITCLSGIFGVHFEILEMCELKELRDNISENEIKEKIKEFHEAFNVSEECDDFELDRAARTSCALDKLIKNNKLGSLAYYYEGSNGNDYENIVTSVIAGNSLLTAKGIPVAGECEIKNVLAMKIMDSFGVGGSFSEFYALDFNDDVVLFGHDGPAHFKISEGKVGLVPLPVYHGKPGKGLSIQMTVKHGPVTLLSIVEHGDGTFSFLAAEGESVPGPILEIGNTNSRYKFNISTKEFVNKWSMAGPAHHCAIGIGHISSKIEKLAILLKNIKFEKIC